MINIIVIYLNEFLITTYSGIVLSNVFKQANLELSLQQQETAAVSYLPF
jgi:hypothetical protein